MVVLHDSNELRRVFPKLNWLESVGEVLAIVVGVPETAIFSSESEIIRDSELLCAVFNYDNVLSFITIIYCLLLR